MAFSEPMLSRNMSAMLPKWPSSMPVKTKHEHSVPMVKLFLLGICHSFLGGVTLCVAIWNNDDDSSSPGDEGKALNVVLGMSGAMQIANTPLLLTLMTKDLKNARDIEDFHRAWFFGGTWYLSCGSCIELAIIFVTVLNENDQEFKPLLCSVYSSGLGFILLMSLIGSITFLVDFTYHTFLAFSSRKTEAIRREVLRICSRICHLCGQYYDSDLWSRSNETNDKRFFIGLIAGVVLLSTGIASLVFLLAFYFNKRLDSLLKFRVLRLVSQIMTMVVLLAIFNFSARGSDDEEDHAEDEMRDMEGRIMHVGGRRKKMKTDELLLHTNTHMTHVRFAPSTSGVVHESSGGPIYEDVDGESKIGSWRPQSKNNDVKQHGAPEFSLPPKAGYPAESDTRHHWQGRKGGIVIFTTRFQVFFQTARFRHGYRRGYGEEENSPNRMLEGGEDNESHSMENTPKRAIFYTCLLGCSLCAHGLAAYNVIHHGGGAIEQQHGYPRQQALWNNVLECVVAVLMYILVIVRPLDVGKSSKLIFQTVVVINYIGAVFEDLEHMLHAFGSCDSSYDGNSDHHSSSDHHKQIPNSVYLELIFFALYSEFCLFSFELFGNDETRISAKKRVARVNNNADDGIVDSSSFPRGDVSRIGRQQYNNNNAFKHRESVPTVKELRLGSQIG
eukprot:jgi/Bigna1/69990/fgenesh1_pg.10_\